MATEPQAEPLQVQFRCWVLYFFVLGQAIFLIQASVSLFLKRAYQHTLEEV